MANAKKCDRCGNFYVVGDYGVSKRGTFVTGITFNRPNGGTEDSADLCKDCIEKLKLFLDGAKLDSEKE